MFMLMDRVKINKDLGKEQLRGDFHDSNGLYDSNP